MSDTNLGYLTTFGGYAALAGAGYLLYHVSTQKARKRITATQSKAPKAAQPEPRKEDRKKRQRLESYATVAAQDTDKSSKTDTEAKQSDPGAWPTEAPEDDGAANREFAKQLAKAKEGTKFASKSEGRNQREKSVKQSRANQIPGTSEKKKTAVEEPSAAPSSSGADADDDRSSVASPEAAPADASGVADMLQPAPSGPSILRLTDTTEKKQNKKAPKAPETVESKKQRQNRKKAEAAKASRQEAEQERKGLENTQRRQARIAEGRAAKDGSQFLATNGNKSAWTQGAPNGSSNTSAKVSSVPEENVFHAPLDTFEESASTSSIKEQPTASQSKDAWVPSIPSEEEQLERLKEETDDWNTVKTKSSKKTSKKDSSHDFADKPAQSQPSVRSKQSAPARPAANQSFGSFSALTSNDDVADDAEEEEWEV